MSEEHLSQANPTGRLDVLVYRVVEMLAQSQCPVEWPVLAPHVEEFCKTTLGPDGRLFR